jgi:uncharacterized protein (TIGR03437 family)
MQVRYRFTLALFLGIGIPLAHSQTPSPKRPLVGAIRWDGWAGSNGPVGLTGQTELGPEHWHYRVPFFGQIVSSTQVLINGASQAVVDQEIAYAKASLLDYWAFVTYDPEADTSLSLQYYLSSSHRGDISFCMITEQPRWGGQNGTWAENRVIPLMKQPTYLKVLGGRPLFYLMSIDDQSVAQQWGSMAGFRQAVDGFRSGAQSAGVGNPYIVIMDSDPVRAHSLAQQLGGDAIGSYNQEASKSVPPGAPFLSLASYAESQWDRFRATGSPVVPMVMSGYDRRPRVENPAFWESSQQPGVGLQYYYQAPQPSEIAGHLRNSFYWVNRDSNSDPANVVLIYAWNENAEGGWIVPTLSEGSARLDAVHGALASKPTVLSLSTAPTQVGGRLADSSGQPVPGAPVAISMSAQSGGGLPGTYNVQGAIPLGTQSINLGFRVNAECSCSGPAEFWVTSFSLITDSGNSITRDFSNQLNGWSVGGDAGASAQLDGSSLHVIAQAGKQFYTNLASSISFSGTGNFQFQVNAKVSPVSVGSGYFFIAFNGSTGGLLRAEIPFQSANVALGVAQTGSDGSFNLPIPIQFQIDGLFKVTGSYPGADAFWPSSAETMLDPTPAIKSIVNGATFRSEPFAPGTWATIFGQNLGRAGQWTATDTLNLGGAGVSVCGLPAAVAYNSGPVSADGVLGWQLNELIPDGVTGRSSCPVIVTVDGRAAQSVDISIGTGVLELFSFTTSDGSLPIVTHADYSLVGPASAGLVPARSGEAVIAWGTGDCAPPTIAVGGKSAAVQFSGRVGPGLCQLNFVVPNGLSGANQLKVSTASQTQLLWVAPQP